MKRVISICHVLVFFFGITGFAAERQMNGDISAIEYAIESAQSKEGTAVTDGICKDTETGPEFLSPENLDSPSSRVLPLGDVYFTEVFNVNFEVFVTQDSYDFVELFYQFQAGDWQYYATIYSGNHFTFDASQAYGPGRYSFYTIVADTSGNQESPPSEADATTLVLTEFNGDRIYVDINAEGIESGLTWENAFTSLNCGILTAQTFNVSEIWVSAGRYSESIQIPSYLNIYGGFDGTESSLFDREVDDNKCIIDGSQADSGFPARHVVRINSVHDVTLDGFYITGGHAEGTGSDNTGGGIYTTGTDESVSIANCRITGNYAETYGGGLFAGDSEIKLFGCIVYGNTANQRGGGLFMSENDLAMDLSRKKPKALARRASAPGPMINNCTIAGNNAYQGAGVCNDKLGSTITNSIISGNTALDTGGGLQYTGDLTLSRRGPRQYDPPATNYTPTLINSVVSSNRAFNGAGIDIDSDVFDSIYNLVVRNHADSQVGGGGISMINSCSITNTIISDNIGTGIKHIGATDDSNILNCLFYNNQPADFRINSDENVCTGANEINMNVNCAMDNRTGDPLLGTILQGTWTRPPLYMPEVNQTILIDESADWVPGEFRWMMLETAPDNHRDFLIVNNTSRYIIVSGNAVAWADIDDPYRIPDYHIGNGSAALDRGHPDQDIFWDCDMDDRPGSDSLFDIGPDEAPSDWEPVEDDIDPVSWIVDLPVLITTPTIEIQFIASDAESGIAEVALYYRHEFGFWTSYGPASTQNSITFDMNQANGQGRYYFATIATDNAGNLQDFPDQYAHRTWVITDHPGDRIYVNEFGYSGQTGSSWECGVECLDPVLAMAIHYNVYEVWVAEGAYQSQFEFISHLKMYGGFAGTETSLDQRVLGQNETILDGEYGLYFEDSYHVVIMRNVQHCLLDGFTIRGGNARGTGSDGRGGGIYTENLDDTSTIMNCDIINNTAVRGGGLYGNLAYTQIQNCRFLLNTAQEKGGGIYLAGDTREDSQKLINCIIGGNSAENGGGAYLTISSSNALSGSHRAANQEMSRATGTVANMQNCMITENISNYSGGGLFIEAASEMENCTIADNFSTYGGGIYCAHDSFATNSIIWGNQPNGITTGGYSPEITYSNIQGGFSGQGNINVDPLFAQGPYGQYYLSHVDAGQLATSPCIDSGQSYSEDVCMDARYGLICMNTLTNRTDEIVDSGICNMGFHHHPQVYIPPTQTPIPTRTMTPTPRPWISPTPKPSNTPMNTYTPSATPTFTPTRAPTYTPTPDAPSPTPFCKKLGVTIDMPSDNMTMGMDCYCHVRVCNTTGLPLEEHPLFVILDVLGSLYFAPTFSSEFDNYLDQIPVFQQGLTTVEVLPLFQWPDIQGSASEVYWYAALTNPDVSEIIGQSDVFRFGWNN